MRSCTRWMVLRGIEPFMVTRVRAPAMSPISGKNRAGSGRRDMGFPFVVSCPDETARPGVRRGHKPPPPLVGVGLTDVLHERRQLTGLAYRLLGSLSDAEDVVQEAYGRWYAMSPREQAAIESPGAWLTKVASRICLT